MCYSVMYGPLSRELKVRKKPERRARENDEVLVCIDMHYD